MARPLVASPVGARGLPGVPGENLLAGDDPAAMVRHLRAVLGDDALGARIAAGGRRAATESYDLSRVAGDFARICDEVAARAEAPR
jgi:glycosyltransferase involved in cell wall biosynthesis